MDGIIVINKPQGCTSHDIVYKVKKIYGEKVGHTGTLDPNATGVLPILIGNGTKLSKYLINHDKTYIATIQLGIKTDSADSEGNQIENKPVLQNIYDEDFIKNTLKDFQGKQIQTPPIYSAIKVKGKKLYQYARSGQEVEIPKREINIYKINVIEINKCNNQIVIEVECSKGTYIRSLCENIAEKLGTVGYMKDLIRTKVGDFKIEQSVRVEELSTEEEFLNEHLITIEKLLKNNDNIILDKNEINKFLNGVKLERKLSNGIYKIYDESNRFIGTGIIEEEKLKRDICQ